MRSIALTATFLVALLHGEARAGDDPAAPLGTNLVGISDFSDERPFVDLMKSSRDWIPGNATGCFDCRESTSGACAAQCPVTVARDAQGWVASLAPNQVVRSVVHAAGSPNRLPTGEYTIRFEGAGTIQPFGASVVSSEDGELVVSPSGAEGNNFGFTITATDAGDPLREIRILPPGGVCANDGRRYCDDASPCASGATCRRFTDPGVAEAQLFHPRFLANLAGYRLVRFMDWMETNSSGVVTFDDYPTPESAFWHRVPPAIIAELGNRLASDLWINVPHRADDGFVDGFAAALRDAFRADRRIYVEYSNENWNGIFAQNVEIPRQFCPGYTDLAAACEDDGVPGNGVACERHPDTFSLGAAQGPCFEALVRAWGDRSTEIFARFDAVFGEDARARLVRVVAAQAANADLGRQVLSRTVTGESFTVASRTDVYAIAPYFGTEYCTPDDGINPDSHPEVYASAASLLDDLRTRALPTAIGFMSSNRAMLEADFADGGLRLVAYEAGQHLAGIGGFTFDDTCNTRFDAANADPAMGTLYRDYLDAWMQHGHELAHFYNVGRWGPFGRWGALEFQEQAPASAPKFAAMLGFSADTPCWWDGCAQPAGAPDSLFADGFE